MRLRDNVRAVASTVVGLGGLGVGMLGWAAKAITPASASVQTKAATGGVTSVLVSAATYAALGHSGPNLLHFVDPNITLTISAIDCSLAAAYTGACTAVSYLLGGGWSRGTEAPPKQRQLNLR